MVLSNCGPPRAAGSRTLASSPNRMVLCTFNPQVWVSTGAQKAQIQLKIMPTMVIPVGVGRSVRGSTRCNLYCNDANASP